MENEQKDIDLTKSDKTFTKINMIVREARTLATDPLRVPVELRSLNIETREPLDIVKTQAIKTLMSLPIYKRTDDDKFKKRIIENVIGAGNLKWPLGGGRYWQSGVKNLIVVVDGVRIACRPAIGGVRIGKQ